MKSLKALRESEELKLLKTKLEIVKMECKREEVGLEKLKVQKRIEVSKVAKAFRDLAITAKILVTLITVHWGDFVSWFMNLW